MLFLKCTYCCYWLNAQICYTIWTDLRICSSCWDTVPWICYNSWSCYHWTASDNSLAMDGSQSPRDSWGTLWLPFPVEPLKLFTSVWRVSLELWIFLLYIWYPFIIKKFLTYIFHTFHSADFHDYHHRLLYTKSGNYSSTFTYMDWYVFTLFCLKCYELWI